MAILGAEVRLRNCFGVYSHSAKLLISMFNSQEKVFMRLNALGLIFKGFRTSSSDWLFGHSLFD